MTAYALYNEIDPYAADWLENLIAANLIAPGIVDRRSIEDLRGDDLRGFRQVHFFAGIGVWSYALRRAGVTDDIPLWTGSCPCQPFSAAGKGTGVDDERHLWPAFLHLIRECRPERVFGEQVASKDGLGWLDLVSTDLEAEEYAIGTVDTCSAGSGAPHIRQRLRFYTYDLRSPTSRVGNAEHDGSYRSAIRCGFGKGEVDRRLLESEGSGPFVRLDHHHHQGLEGFGRGHRSEIGHGEGSLRPVAETGELGRLALPNLERHSIIQRGGSSIAGREGEFCGPRARSELLFSISGLADDLVQQRPNREPGIRDVDDARGRLEGSTASSGLHDTRGLAHDGSGRREVANIDGRSLGSSDGERQANQLGVCGPSEHPGPTNGHWRDADWLFCRDGRWRPVESESFPLVDGAAFRVGSGSPFEGKSRQGMLKAYGNAIDAEATIDFIKACLAERPVVDLGVGSIEEMLV